MIEFGSYVVVFGAGLLLGTFLGVFVLALLFVASKPAPEPPARPVALLPDVNPRPLYPKEGVK